MVDNGRNSNSANRGRHRAIRAEMSRTGETYNVVARRHDEREERRRTAKEMPLVRCPRCRQPDVRIDEQPSCTACGAVWESGAELAGEYAEEILGLNAYTAVKDGGEEPTADCPDCWVPAVVSIQPEDAKFWTMMCLACEATFNDRCTRCGAPIRHREDGDLIICTACWDDVVSRS